MKTLTIEWLNKCRCGNKLHTVKTARGNESALWDDDAVKCDSCGRGGVIQVCEGQARVLWETDEEMVEGKPMSTITKEWLQQKIAGMEATRDEIPFGLGEDGTNTLAALRIALESLEAEAVAEVCEGFTLRYIGHGPAPKSGVHIGDRLFTAPPAPVSVPDEGLLHMAASAIEDLLSSKDRSGAGVWADVPSRLRRAAMLQGADGTLTNEGTIPVTQFKPVADLYGLTSPTGGETSFTFDAVEARDFIDGGWSCQEYVELERFQEAVSGNSPVIPDGFCIMPKKLTAENGGKGALSGEFHVTNRIVCQSCGGEGCEDCNDEGGWDAEIPVSWDTIKRIHEAAVEACSLPAAPQQEVK